MEHSDLCIMTGCHVKEQDYQDYQDNERQSNIQISGLQLDDMKNSEIFIAFSVRRKKIIFPF